MVCGLFLKKAVEIKWSIEELFSITPNPTITTIAKMNEEESSGSDP